MRADVRSLRPCARSRPWRPLITHGDVASGTSSWPILRVMLKPSIHFVAEHMPGYRSQKHEGTFLMWLDMTRFGKAAELDIHPCKEYGWPWGRKPILRHWWQRDSWLISAVPETRLWEGVGMMKGDRRSRVCKVRNAINVDPTNNGENLE